MQRNMEINKEFVYDKYPKTEHDVQLLEDYRKALKGSKPSDVPQLRFFPVDEGCSVENKEMPRLTHFGFLALAADEDFMYGYFTDWCSYCQTEDLSALLPGSDEVRALRAFMVEFAIMGDMDAQKVLTRLNKLYGDDDAFVEELVTRRCPNLKRFVNAQEGSADGIIAGEGASTYEKALKEIKAGRKVSHWIWYVFPQMAGIPGTHSRPALFYGIMGRKEAYQYINHPTLRKRLIEVAQAVKDNPKTVYEIFGNDAMKVRASMMLFASVSDDLIFKSVCKKYKWI